MAKRLRDTDSYKDKFVKSLPPDYKHLWFYILDACDHAGIWRVDLEGASLYTGCKFSESEALAVLGDKVMVAGEDFWFIPGFLKFQYGKEANPKAGVVISARKRLVEFGLEGFLNEAVQSSNTPDTLPTPSQEGLETPKDKSKSKSKDKSKVSSDFELFWAEYPRKVGKGAAEAKWKKAVSNGLTIEQALEALRWQKKSKDHLGKEEPQYIAHPETWLNQSRWMDEKPFDRAEVKAAMAKILPTCQHEEVNTLKEFGVKDGVPMVKLQDTCKCGHAFAPAYHSAEDLRAMLKYAPTLTATKDLIRELEAYAAKGGA